MLVLTRKTEESINIGDSIRVTVLAIDGGQIRLGIEAPRSIAVHRGEVYERIQNENRLASAVGRDLVRAAEASRARRDNASAVPPQGQSGQEE